MPRDKAAGKEVGFQGPVRPEAVGKKLSSESYYYGKMWLLS